MRLYPTLDANACRLHCASPFAYKGIAREEKHIADSSRRGRIAGGICRDCSPFQRLGLYPPCLFGCEWPGRDGTLHGLEKRHRQQSLGTAARHGAQRQGRPQFPALDFQVDRKSTRLNSSHLVISYAVFCLKKKKPTILLPRTKCSLTTSPPFAAGSRCCSG